MGASGTRTAVVIALSALFAAPVLSACTHDEPSARHATASDATLVQTDVAPMEARFPALGPISAAHYVDAAASGRSDLPSPDHAYDAALQITPESAKRLGSRYHLVAAPDGPEVSSSVTTHLPSSARWLRSGALDKTLQKSQNAYSSSQGHGGHWRLRAHVDVATGTVAVRWFSS